jgi:arginyl-tRNA synthetase
MNVLQALQEKLRAALTGLVPDPAPYATMLRPAQDARFGDYQANCAMSLAKALGKPHTPLTVAQAILERLDLGDMLEKPDVAGPGFINLRLRRDWLARQVQAMARGDRLGVEPVQPARTFVVDYSSPNVAKPMHVGHLRSTIIGDALARLLRFLGHKVITDNHLGDWGTQFGMILWGWKNHRDEQAYLADPVGELARLYRLAQGLIKQGEEHGKDLAKVQSLEAQGKAAEAANLFGKLFGARGLTREQLEAAVERGWAVDEASRAETAKLHAGDPENHRLWQQFMPHCLAALCKVYERLGVCFDEQLGESDYNDALPGIVADLQKRGLAVDSEGAVCVFVEGMQAPFIVRKRDGAFNYATTDLATIQYRQEHFTPDAILYLVDHRQADHFKALFDVARRWGYTGIEFQHVGFGTVMGQDRKPFKAREGDVVGLESLLEEAVVRARRVVEENSPDLPPDQRGDVAEIVGIGAVKYADLSQARTSDYVFDWDKMLAMDGNTATYMQYAYARNRSIFRRGGEDAAPLRADPPLPDLRTPYERALALQLVRFPEALNAAVADYKPNVITAYLWDLAKAYSGFFENCPVLKAETPELRRSRLLLCDLTARVIQRGLDLLGIRTVERM